MGPRIRIGAIVHCQKKLSGNESRRISIGNGYTLSPQHPLEFFIPKTAKQRNQPAGKNCATSAIRPVRPWVSLQTRAAMCQLPAVQPIIALKGSFLSRDEVRALLAVPDLIMLTLLYNTDAPVSEMIGIRVADITLAATSSVRLYPTPLPQASRGFRITGIPDPFRRADVQLPDAYPQSEYW